MADFGPTLRKTLNHSVQFGTWFSFKILFQTQNCLNKKKRKGKEKERKKNPKPKLNSFLNMLLLFLYAEYALIMRVN